MEHETRGDAGRGVLRFMKGVLWFLLAVLMLSGVLLIAESLLFGDRIPGNIGWKPAAAKTNAMEPTVRKGDLVILYPVGEEELTEGTVVSYRTEAGFVLGRITARNGAVSLVKGDAETESVTVENAEIRGVWRGTRIPLIGYFVSTVQNSPKLVLAIVAAVLLFLLISAIARRSVDESGNVYSASSGETEGVAFVLCCLSLMGGSLYLRHMIRKGNAGGTERGDKR